MAEITLGNQYGVTRYQLTFPLIISSTLSHQSTIDSFIFPL